MKAGLIVTLIILVVLILSLGFWTVSAYMSSDGSYLSGYNSNGNSDYAYMNSMSDDHVVYYSNPDTSSDKPYVVSYNTNTNVEYEYQQEESGCKGYSPEYPCFKYPVVEQQRLEPCPKPPVRCELCYERLAQERGNGYKYIPEQKRVSC